MEKKESSDYQSLFCIFHFTKEDKLAYNRLAYNRYVIDMVIYKS